MSVVFFFFTKRLIAESRCNRSLLRAVGALKNDKLGFADLVTSRAVDPISMAVTVSSLVATIPSKAKKAAKKGNQRHTAALIKTWSVLGTAHVRCSKRTFTESAENSSSKSLTGPSAS